MKINSKINKRVNESVAECRRVITEATIELLKKTGAASGEDVPFGKVMIFFQMRNGQSETIVCDSIIYSESEGNDSFFALYMGGKAQMTSSMLSLSNLQYVYNEILKLVRAK